MTKQSLLAGIVLLGLWASAGGAADVEFEVVPAALGAKLTRATYHMLTKKEVFDEVKAPGRLTPWMTPRASGFRMGGSKEAATT
jgi:hypothetical protein